MLRQRGSDRLRLMGKDGLLSTTYERYFGMFLQRYHKKSPAMINYRVQTPFLCKCTNYVCNLLALKIARVPIVCAGR